MVKKAQQPTAETLTAMYEAMLAACGPRHWWPARTTFEVCAGAILTQNTAWRNVRRAIDNLRRARCLSLAAMRRIPTPQLAELIRPSGYYNMKAQKLKNFIAFLDANHRGSLARLFKLDVPDMRRELLGVNGIGPETADSIILYAAEKPIFVIDAYTRRILSRHGLAQHGADYDDLRMLFESHLPADTALYNEYHALIVFVGHHWCKRNPLCDECPLKPFL